MEPSNLLPENISFIVSLTSIRFALENSSSCWELHFQIGANLLHLDQASAHISTTLRWPENVVPIFQPAHSPELNPIERVWQDLKKLFKSQNFESLAALQQRVFEEVNSLTQSALRSLTGWSYLLRAKNSLKVVQPFS